ncbi:MAG: ABC transporter ATP-binding protein [Christensenellales bacterium]|jgi:putative ABC transport system ATP-binding protein
MVEVVNLYKEYGDGEEKVKALRNINLKVEPGEFLAIMGPSGSGKSTLMNILGCLDRPTTGKYFLCGQDTAIADEDTLAAFRNRMIGFVFQSFFLLPSLTAAENVELPLFFCGVPAKKRREKAEGILCELGLEGRLRHYPSQLSGGQRQRVAIARALINEAPLILADEPTGNLDSQTSHGIMQLFRSLHKRGRTLILITHEKEVAAYAHKVVYIQDGLAVRGGAE